MKVSAVIIAFNEEAKIADAVRSASWADEVLVVDSESTDRTRDIAVECGARIVIQPWLGFGPQKQFAVNAAKYDMILSLDADEVVSNGLRDEIIGLMSQSDTADAYRIPRLANYLGRDIKHCGWYPDAQIRFFDRRKGSWSPSVVHESVVMTKWATVGRLRCDILHYSIDSIRQHSEMITARYAPLSAEAMLLAGQRASKLKIAFSPIASFVSTYFFKLGFLDGFPGLVIAYFAAFNVFLKHVLLWERQQHRDKAVGGDQNYN